MGMLVTFDAFMLMAVHILILTVGMGVDMGMVVDMGMNQFPMPMLMAVGVGMLVGMLQGNGIFDHQNSRSHHQAAQTGENTLDGGYLNRAFGAEHSGAVILQAPAAGRTQNQEGTCIELKTSMPFEAQGNAGGSNQSNGQYQTF